MSSEDRPTTKMRATYERAQAVKRTHEADLMRKPNVVGVSVGLRRRAGRTSDEYVIVAFVRRKVPTDQLAPEDVIPDVIEGVPVDVQAVGKIVAQGRENSP